MFAIVMKDVVLFVHERIFFDKFNAFRKINIFLIFQSVSYFIIGDPVSQQQSFGYGLALIFMTLYKYLKKTDEVHDKEQDGRAESYPTATTAA